MFVFGMMDLNMKEIGKRINSMVKEFSHILMIGFMRESLFKEKGVVMEKYVIQMVSVLLNVII